MMFFPVFFTVSGVVFGVILFIAMLCLLQASLFCGADGRLPAGVGFC